MTRERIAALESGRATDRLIAERVMGWTWITFDGENREWLSPCTVGGERPSHPWHRVGDGSKTRDLTTIPRFSSDIAEAFRVVAYMREHGDSRFKNLSLTAYCYSRTYASFDGAAFGDWSPETHAEANGEYATPLAICMAALMAIEEMDADKRKLARTVRA